MRTLVLTLALLLTTPAHATDAPSAFDKATELGAGEEPPAPELGDEPGDAHLDQLIKLYNAHKYLTASKGLYELLEDDTLPGQESRIHYYLGMCLWKLSLVHSSQHHLMAVARRGPRDPYFRYAIPRLVSAAELTGDRSELARIARVLPAADVPTRAQPEFAWLRGLEAVEEGDLGGAQRELKQVPGYHPLYLRARYVEGVVQYERGRLKSAVHAFKDVYTAELQPRSQEELVELRHLQDLALMGMARTYFSVGSYDKADELYAKVDPESLYWPEAWYERAWSRFHQADLNRSLGLLRAVHSPYYPRELLPEARWLEALNWFQLCEWKRSEHTLLALEEDLEPRMERTRDLVERYRDPSTHDLLNEAWAEVWSGEAGLDERTLSQLLRQGEIEGLARHLALMEEEVERIEDQKLAWRDSVGQHLLAVIAKDRQKLQQRAGAVTVEELGRQLVMLQDVSARSRLLRFEILDAQRIDYEYIMMNPVVPPEEERYEQFATSRDTVYWPWNGEYWEDELPYYSFGQQSQCRQ